MIVVLAVQFLWNETIFLSGNNHILTLSFFISILCNHLRIGLTCTYIKEKDSYLLKVCIPCNFLSAIEHIRY